MRAQSAPLNRCCLLALSLLAIAPVHAATYSVGTGAGCTHATIQSAIDAANASSGFDTVRVSRSLTWTAQALVITTSQTEHLDLVGGFATCAQAAADTTLTVISGAGGALEPVLRIAGQLGGVVRVRRLQFSNGDVASHSGGGIRFSGCGTLDIGDSTISGNTADNGGGIAVSSMGGVCTTKLILGNGAQIIGNTARLNGGGIYLDDAEMDMFGSDSIIFNNEANGTGTAGYGGGLLVQSSGRPALARIGSSGLAGLAAIQLNRARYGGGVAILGASGGINNPTAELQMYSPTAGQPRAAISSNTAALYGGALYIRPYQSTTPSQNVLARARLWRARLYDNLATDGAAVYVDRHVATGGDGLGGELELDVGNSPNGPCPSAEFCSLIEGNKTVSPQGTPTHASIFRVQQGTAHIGRSPTVQSSRGGPLMRNNIAGWLFNGEQCLATLSNTLITGNTMSGNIIGSSCLFVDLSDLTIAGNSLDGPAVLNMHGEMALRRSVLWQPGKLSFQGSALRSILDVVTQESASIDGGPLTYVKQANPRFVDPARGDYNLRAASAAVDYAPAITSVVNLDAMGLARDVNLPFNGDTPRGPRDVGALERQSLAPMVLFGDFDVAADIAMWPEVTAGASTWTSAQNVAGAAGSGSIAVSMSNIPQSRVTVRSQCIHLPGPGTYRLNGWGRSIGQIGSRDTVLLHWQLRHAGGEACNIGAVAASGDHVLSASTSWVQPAVPATIDLTAANWTESSALIVSMVVIDNSITGVPTITGWFDGITLTVDGGDTIFRNDFETP